MSVGDEAWADIRRAYADSSDSIAAIARKAGVSASAIHRRARFEGWARRSGGGAVGAVPQARRQPGLVLVKGGLAKGGLVNGSPAKEDAGKARSAKAARGDSKKPAGAGKAAAKPGSVVKRLYRAIDLKLKRLEERMQSSDELSAADSEREARELSSMIRSFEKVTEVAADIDKRRKPVASARKPVRPEDAERMRREIAERLERLHATGLPDTGSE